MEGYALPVRVRFDHRSCLDPRDRSGFAPVISRTQREWAWQALAGRDVK